MPTAGRSIRPKGWSPRCARFATGCCRRSSAGGHTTPRPTLSPDVDFVGLWDTVDAYGLPMDEMTRGWDKWVWPLSMGDHTRPDKREKICHAVALDDERHTFHPVLLDESKRAGVRPRPSQEKLTQVWFAGVHSNVGGGYPDDSLAHVSLRWMADEARQKGCVLHPHAMSEWAARADPNGPLVDSRAGTGQLLPLQPQEHEEVVPTTVRRMCESRGRRSTRVCSAALRSAATTTHPSSCPSTTLSCKEDGDARSPARTNIPRSHSRVAPIRNGCGTWCGGAASPTSPRWA